MMRQTMAAAQQQGGGAGTTVYVEEDFTATTTGDLTTSNLAVDELGGGWVASASDFAYSADGSGVECTNNLANILTKIQTDGREDVRVTCSWVANNNTNNDAFWQGFCFRSGSSTARTDTLYVRLEGPSTDGNLALKDDTNTLETWDLSVLLGAAVVSGDHLVVVIDCSGDNITLVSVDVNGAGPTAINDTHTLTGGMAIAHGAGSGADYYGLYSNDKSGSSERFKYFKVETIPA